jgi:hypothetical protein
VRIEDWGATPRGGAGGRLGKESRLPRLPASSSLHTGDNPSRALIAAWRAWTFSAVGSSLTRVRAREGSTVRAHEKAVTGRGYAEAGSFTRGERDTEPWEGAAPGCSQCSSARHVSGAETLPERGKGIGIRPLGVWSCKPPGGSWG